MSIRTFNAEAVKEGGCNACNRQVLLESPWTYGKVRVVQFDGGLSFRLCSACRDELRKELA